MANHAANGYAIRDVNYYSIMPEPISRRQLFRFKLSDIARHFKEPEKPIDDKPKPEKAWFRPPGAIAEEDFLEKCSRCSDCVDACPYGVISKLGAAEGRLEGSPVLKPVQSPCHWCEDMPCIQSCGTGALVSKLIDGDKSIVNAIGKAEIDHSACLIAEGILCDTCATRCPVSVKAIRMVGRRVELDMDRCVGCGLCAYHCEAESGAIKVKPTRRN